MDTRSDHGLATTFLWLEGYGGRRRAGREWVRHATFSVVLWILAAGAATLLSMARDARHTAYEQAWELPDRG